jgi:hypothetical protein
MKNFSLLFLLNVVVLRHDYDRNALNQKGGTIMKGNKKMFRIVGNVLFIGLVLFTILFGVYQIFFDKAEAALFHCDTSVGCFFTSQDCSGSITCHCTGPDLRVCTPGAYKPNQ